MTRSISSYSNLNSVETQGSFIILLKMSGGGLPNPLYIANGYTTRISETDTDIVYGIKSSLGGAPSNNYTYFPITIELPNELESQAPTATLTVYGATAEILSNFLALTSGPQVDMYVVYADHTKDPDTVITNAEVSITGLTVGDISFTQSTVVFTLTIDGLESEPFPQHSFLPNSFPGLF